MRLLETKKHLSGTLVPSPVQAICVKLNYVPFEDRTIRARAVWEHRRRSYLLYLRDQAQRCSTTGQHHTIIFIFTFNRDLCIVCSEQIKGQIEMSNHPMRCDGSKGEMLLIVKSCIKAESDPVERTHLLCVNGSPLGQDITHPTLTLLRPHFLP